MDYLRVSTCIVFDLHSKLLRIGPNCINVRKITKKKSLKKISTNDVDRPEKKWYFVIIFFSTIKEVAWQRMCKEDFLCIVSCIPYRCDSIIWENNCIILTNKSGGKAKFESKIELSQSRNSPTNRFTSKWYPLPSPISDHHSSCLIRPKWRCNIRTQCISKHQIISLSSPTIEKKIM